MNPSIQKLMDALPPNDNRDRRGAFRSGPSNTSDVSLKRRLEPSSPSDNVTKKARLNGTSSMSASLPCECLVSPTKFRHGLKDTLARDNHRPNPLVRTPFHSNIRDCDFNSLKEI
jgi:hypothetical protein